MKFKTKDRQIRPPAVRTAAVYALYVNILIYLFFAVMLIYGRNAVIPFEKEPHPPHPAFTPGLMFYFLLSTYLYVFVLFCINFYILRRNKLENRMKAAVAVVVSLVFILLWNYLTRTLQHAFFDLPPLDPRALFGGLVRDFILGALVVFSSQLMYANYRRQLANLENEALKAEYERARYQTLRNQINPHFLFNTLNTLNSTIAKDPEMAQQYVQKLSSIFRYTIQDRESTSLQDEIGFSRNFSDLMQIRYGENLQFVYDIDAKYETYFIVPYSIQTLVENAIKHNSITSRQPLTITVSTGPEGTITVSNPIHPKKDREPGEGIGLANLSERYRLKWGKDIAISNENGVFSVTLPLIAPVNANGILS